MVSYLRPTLSFLSNHHKHAASFSKLPPNHLMDLLGLVFQTNFNQLGKMAMFKLKKPKSLSRFFYYTINPSWIIYRMLDSGFEPLYPDCYKSSALPFKLNQQKKKKKITAQKFTKLKARGDFIIF